MSYLPIIPKFLETNKHDIVKTGLLVNILNRVEKNFEMFDHRITELENLNNVKHAFSSSTEDFASSENFGLFSM